MNIQGMANRCEGHLCAQSEDFDIFNPEKRLFQATGQSLTMVSAH
ncbi:hypothetical protein WH390_07810 [Candidatus Arsenophonus nilaparvatae]|nr:hypothetical protein [Candidatus Arsenophonus nilaparvatae]